MFRRTLTVTAGAAGLAMALSGTTSASATTTPAAPCAAEQSTYQGWLATVAADAAKSKADRASLSYAQAAISPNEARARYYLELSNHATTEDDQNYFMILWVQWDEEAFIWRFTAQIYADAVAADVAKEQADKASAAAARAAFVACRNAAYPNLPPIS